MDLEYTQEEIDAFVRGKLSPEEREVFVQKMKESPALADAVAEAQFALDIGTTLLKQDLRKMMRSWEEEKKTSNAPGPAPSNTPTFRKWWLWALLGLIFFTAALLLWSPPTLPSPAPAPVATPPPTTTPEPDNQEIAENPETPTTLPSPEREKFAMRELHLERGDGSSRQRNEQVVSDTGALERGDWLIKKGEYKEGLRLLQRIPPAREDDYWSAQLYIGDAYFFQKQFSKAEKIYLEVQKQGEAFLPDLFWRLAAVYCAQGKSSVLKSHLSPVLNKTGHPDYARATRLLEASKTN